MSKGESVFFQLHQLPDGFSDTQKFMKLGACTRPQAEIDVEAVIGEDPLAVRALKKVCMGCPDKLDCLSYALQYEIETDVWGGKTPEERDEAVRMQSRASRIFDHPTK